MRHRDIVSALARRRTRVSTPAGVLLGAETSGMAIDFTSAPISTLVRTASSLSTNYYSGLPFQNEGNGPVTFSRASNATVTDSDGKVKWAGHNLLTNSESFGATAWTKASVTVSANSTSAPNGTTTADKVVSTSGTGEQRIYIGSVVPSTVGIRYTFPVFAKADGANWLVIRDALSGFGDTSFDLVNGAVGTVASGRTATITSVGNGFYLCSVSNTVTASYVVGDISYCLADVDNGRATFVGNGTKALILWGAHLYRSDLGGMVLNPARGDAYYPTTPRNLLGYTESFNNTSGWTVTDATVTADTIAAPNGLTVADAIYETATTAVHGVLTSVNTTTVSSTKYVASVYAKANGRNFCALLDSQTGVGKYFDLVNGTVLGDYNASPPVAASITPVGSGWYRCSITITATTALRFRIYTSDTGSNASYAGDISKGIYLWGAQLSNSASLDAYSPVYGAAVTSAAYYAPRLDYDPVTLAAKGLLVEEQRTNLALYSAAFNTGWVKSATTVTTGAIIGPTGTLTGDKIVEDTANSQHQVRQAIATTAASHTFSVYAKAGERSFIFLQCDNPVRSQYFNIASGTLGTAFGSPVSSITAVGNGWYRCTMTFTAVAATPTFYIMLASADGTNSYLGDGTSGIFIWGAQLEAGAFATSYIPTGAATATRTADVASVSTQAFPYSATEGTLVVSGLRTALYSVDPVAVALFTNSSNTIEMYTKNSDNRLYAAVGGVEQASFLDVNKIVAGTPFKGAVAYKLNDYAMATNGGTVLTDTTATVPVATTLGIGSRGGSLPFVGYIRQVTYIPRRLSNSELQARTV